MSGAGVRLTAEEVLGLAPDDASRRAGSRLSSPGPWSEAGWGPGAVWGLCKGSGSTPYRTVVDLGGDAGTGHGPAEPGYKCSCPSRKFPCKHALGLLLLWAQEGDEGGAPGPRPTVTGGSPPEWADEWLSRRRARASRGTAAEGERPDGDDGAAGGQHSETTGGTDAPRDGGAAPQNDRDDRDDGGVARRAAGPKAARDRSMRRMRRIEAGAGELEQRLEDLLRAGLAAAGQGGHAQWEETASRMVDAQAPGLAARIRELGALPVTGAAGSPDSAAGSGSGGWPARLLSECALLHLLVRGVLTLDSLPEPLAATVRTRVGLTVDSAELLAGGADRVRDRWLVLARRDTEEGRLTARRTWLRGAESGRSALLLSHAPPWRSPGRGLPVGSSVDAELAYYPGARPLRAALAGQHSTRPLGPVPEGGTVTDALAAYGRALADDPWLETWPAVLSGVVPTLGGYEHAYVHGRDGVPVQTDETGGGGGVADDGHGSGIRQLADADGEFALPVTPGTPAAALWRLAAVSGGRPVTVFGECGHKGFAPYTVWNEGEAVAL